MPTTRNLLVSDRPGDGDIFHALADPTRRAILAALRQGSQPVSHIAGGFAMSRPAISRHLRILREADLVREVKAGRNRVYELHPQPLRDIDEWLAQYRHMWQHQLRNLKRYVEQKAKEH
jgi:DNA-binding transcriptional ArsR family regulator